MMCASLVEGDIHGHSVHRGAGHVRSLMCRRDPELRRLRCGEGGEISLSVRSASGRGICRSPRSSNLGEALNYLDPIPMPVPTEI